VGYNIPSYSVDNITFGPGILYLGTSGATPTVDIGAVTSAKLTMTRAKLEIKQGSPKQLVKRYASEETVQFSITGIEWKPNNIARALGAGVTSGSATTDILEYGGDMNFTSVALKFVHVMPSGDTINLFIWSAHGSGDMEITFGDDVHEIPLAFDALRSSTDWAGATLASNKQFFKLLKEI